MKLLRDPIDIHVGTRLRSLRTERRLSLEELGRRIGVTYQQIQKYETGANRISASTLYRIARSFDISPNYFFEGLLSESQAQSAGDDDYTFLAAAFCRIADAEIRMRLRALIESLAAPSVPRP